MKADYAVDAAWMGSVVNGDPGFQPPVKPYLPAAIVVQPYGSDGILFEGAHGTQIIRGKSARTILAKLIPLLDGRRELDELGVLLPEVSSEQIRDVVALLYSRGLLHDGAPTRALADSLGAFIDRFIDVTRANRNRDEVVARLENARIGIVAGSADREALTHQLAACGIAAIEAWRAESRHTYTLVIAVDNGQTDIDPALVLAYSTGTMQLVARSRGISARVGPLIVPGTTGCFRCFPDLRDDTIATADGLEKTVIPLTALAAFHLVSRLASPLSAGTLLELFAHASRPRSGRRVFSPLPSCVICGTGRQVADRAAAFAIPWLYHHSVAMPPHGLLDDRAYQQHFHPKNVQLRSTKKEPLFGALRYRLPPPASFLGALPWTLARAESKAVDAATLATLLWYSNGYREHGAGVSSAIVPSGGGLESQELYVLLSAPLDGIPEGAFRYNAQQHDLERVARPSERLVRGALGTDDTLPACAIVSVGLISRLRDKYRNFAYRLAHLDAGVAVATLIDVARCLGVQTQLYSKFSDATLAEICALPDGYQQLVTSAVRIGKAPSAGVDPATHPDALLEMLVRLSAVPPARSENSTFEPAPALSVSTGSIDFSDTLLSRRSVRRFAARPLSFDIAFDIMQAATEMRDALHNVGAHRVSPILATTQPLGNAEDGVFALDENGRLVRVGGPFSQAQLAECLQQRDLAQAPMALFLTADLVDQLEARGARGYREAVFCAGAIGWRAMLAAQSHAIGACFSGGFFTAGVIRHVQLGDSRRTPLFALVLGHALVVR